MNRTSLAARLRRLEPAGRELARRTLLRQWEADPWAGGAFWFRCLVMIGAFEPLPREYPRLAERTLPEGADTPPASDSLPPDTPAEVRAAALAMEASWRQETAAECNAWNAFLLWETFDRHAELFAVPGGERRLAAHTAPDLGRPEEDLAGSRAAARAALHEANTRVEQRAAAALGVDRRELLRLLRQADRLLPHGHPEA